MNLFIVFPFFFKYLANAEYVIKFELQVKFRKFLHTITSKKYINLKLTRKNKHFNKRKTAQWYSGTFLLLKPLKNLSIDVTSFRLSKSLNSRSVLFVSNYNFGYDFSIPFRWWNLQDHIPETGGKETTGET